MCTCLKLKGKNIYFGRNMDITHSFNELVIITPRNYTFKFKKIESIANHYSIIGIGACINNYPLYSEASNEYGLAIAGLNFPSNCIYYKYNKNKINLAPYELTLYLLGTCKSVKEVKKYLKNINIISLNFSKDIKLTPLHFMISDKKENIVLETLKDGMKIYDNPFEILTNNPPFYYHQENVKNYLNLHNKDSINYLASNLNITPYSFGQGAFGLPGDYSSSSRFIKIFFNKSFLSLDKDDNDIIQFFKCLDSVGMIKGNVLTEYGYEFTRYSSCINIDKGILYYKTYNNYGINYIDMHKENLNTSKLIIYNLKTDCTFHRQN